MSSFRFYRRGALEYLEALPLAECDFLVHAFLTRLGGVSEGSFAGLNFSYREGDRPEDVASNWRLLTEAFELDLPQFVLMRQMHGDRIVTIDSKEPGIIATSPLIPTEAHVCDALVTNRPEIAIGVRTADCVPLFLVDRVKRVIGVVHAGWRGTALNIAGQAVDVFVERFSSQPGDILAAIGPAIGPCCYEVDAAVYEALKVYPAAGRAPFVHPGVSKDRWMLDLALVNRTQLEQHGVPVENIFSGSHCTSCRSDIFFSHRRDCGRTGRHFSFMMLKAR
ncbi:MAG: peptidoglycan editing factor PgeF [Deltaproteobacteria bacterium]|nr:peptidoglycan editing factor PgeF [Deltaproteobacteria bacterium]